MFAIQVLNWLIDFLQDITPSGFPTNISIDSSLQAIQDVINFISFVLPLDTIIFCFLASLGGLIIRLAVALWKLLPLT